MEEQGAQVDLSQKLEQAFELQQQGDVTRAMDLFSEILSTHPHQPDALHGIGMCWVQQKQPQQALPYLQQAIHHAPHIAEFHNNLANLYKSLGKINEAMIHYQEALRIKPTHAPAHNNLGALYYRLGSYQDALNHFQKAIRIDPHAVDTHYNIANCYVQLDRLTDAINHYQIVLKLRSDHLGALHNLGVSLCTLKRFQEAFPLLEQVIQREPENTDALFHLGVIYSALDQPMQAKRCYEHLLHLQPDHADTHHNLATVFLYLHQLDNAREHYALALQFNPRNKTAKHMLDALAGKTLPEGAPLEYTRALFDQYAYTYDKHVKDNLQYQVPHLLRQAMTPFISSSGAPWDVLDVGCGSGLCAPYFVDVSGKLYGVDLSANMLEVAKQLKVYEKLYLMDITSFFEQNRMRFDLIIAADVFVYFGNLLSVFEHCYHALKEKGCFCFSIESLSEQEKAQDPALGDYQLRKTGRYAHHPDYIHKIAASVNFTLLSETAKTIRLQDSEEVQGRIYVLKKE